MKIKYDPTGDILLITLRERKGHYAESDEVAPGVIVDFDEEGTPLAIEILNARRVMGSGEMFQLELPLNMPVD